jgi:hypothetical protein
MKKCPNCNKKNLLWNNFLRRWECPKEKLGRKGVMEKYGCGYKQENNNQTELNIMRY